MTPDPSQFLDTWRRHPELVGARCYVVGFSGGLDSTVLLDLTRRALARVPGAALLAVHVDHGLHTASAEWARHCENVALRLGVACLVVSADATARAGDSPEAAARDARYAALTDQLRAGDVLLTAHHQDDQLETVLLQLLRGSGVAGLAGMPELSRFAQGWHWRPLLGVPRDGLERYCADARLDWISDPSNVDPRFDRNYLRNDVVPLLRKRWPAAASNVARTARHCAAATHLLTELADQDLDTVCDAEWRLRLGAIEAWSDERIGNLLRAWIARAGLAPPTSAHLQRCLADLVHTRHDAGPLVQWPGTQLRRFRDHLYAMSPLADMPADYFAHLQSNRTLELPAGLGLLRIRPESGEGLSLSRCQEGVDVKFRDGGERIKPAGSRHTRQLRTLFQERGIVPWMRSRIPMLLVDGELAAVGNLWVASAFAAQPAQAGLSIEWLQHPALY